MVTRAVGLIGAGRASAGGASLVGLGDGEAVVGAWVAAAEPDDADSVGGGAA